MPCELMKQILLSVLFYTITSLLQAQTTFAEYDDMPVDFALNNAAEKNKPASPTPELSEIKKIDIKASKRYVDIRGDKDVQFSVTSNFARDYVWKFSDGSMISGMQNTQHTFKETGVYQVQVLASNENEVMRESIDIVVVDSKQGMKLEEMGTYVVFPSDNQLLLDVELNLPRKEKLLFVNIDDISGSGIYTKELRKVKRNQRVKLDFDTLEPGKYYITIKGKRFSSISKLIVAK